MLRVRCFFRHGSFFPCWHVAKPSPEEAAEPSPEEAPSLPFGGLDKASKTA